MHTALVICLFIIGLVLIGIVLVQPGKTDGINFISGGATDTFFSKNKSRTHEAMQVRVTIVCAVLFALLVILLNLID